MKKLFTLLSAALIGTAGMFAADWYLVGDNYVWADNAAYKFTPSADDANVQTLEVASLSGPIKIKEANTWSTSFGSNGAKLAEGVSYKAIKDGGNITVDGTIDNATITINTSTYTILVTGAAKENEYTEVYLIGDFGSGWNDKNTNYPLTLKEGTENVYEGTYTLSAATSYFKMKAGSLVYGTGGADVKVTLGETYTAAQSGNAFSIGAGEYSFSFVLDKNADTGDLTVTANGVVAPTYPETLYVVGHVNGGGFTPDNMAQLTNEGDGIYTGSVVLSESPFSYFQFASAKGANADDWGTVNAGFRYGAPTADCEVTLGEAMEITRNDLSWKLTPAKYDFTVDLENNTMTVEFAEGSAWAIHGCFDGENWESYPMTDNEGTWSVTITPTAATGSFVLKTVIGDVATGWYKADAATTITESETHASVSAAGQDDINYELKADREYTFAFNPETLELVVSFTSGIEVIEAETEAAAEYFNLQGVRVANPGTGLYIRRTAGQAVKVMLK